MEILQEELSELSNVISKPDERVVFFHNDFQYRNIIINENDGDINLIDYEYASYNPMAFDIATHLC